MIVSMHLHKVSSEKSIKVFFRVSFTRSDVSKILNFVHIFCNHMSHVTPISTSTNIEGHLSEFCASRLQSCALHVKTIQCAITPFFQAKWNPHDNYIKYIAKNYHKCKRSLNYGCYGNCNMQLPDLMHAKFQPQYHTETHFCLFFFTLE